MKFNDEGENAALTLLLQSTEAPILYMGLYKNTVEPAEDDVVSDLTQIGSPGFSEGNYANRIAIAKGDWTITADIATNLQKTFTALGDIGNVYGYFLTDVGTANTGKLWAVEHFADGPYNILSGGMVKITPRIIAQ